MSVCPVRAHLCHFFVCVLPPSQNKPENFSPSLLSTVSLYQVCLCAAVEKISFLLKHRRLSQREFSARKQKPRVYFPVKLLRVEPRD